VSETAIRSEAIRLRHPEPPTNLVSAAQRDVPPVLVDIPGYAAASQPLILDLRDQKGHIEAAGEWAVFRLIQAGFLQAYAIPVEPQSTQHLPLMLLYPGNLVVRPTSGLWAWWRDGAWPSPETARIKSPTPNETTEQPIIDALYELGAVGLKGMKALPAEKRPTGERLAARAIGRSCDGQFKATLAHMVDLGWLGNGRSHGLTGGYFLTPAGVALATRPR
jgi:hypothetical protein